jgi:AraC-like DNA-binding protein
MMANEEKLPWARILEAHEMLLGVRLGFYDFKGRLRTLVGEAFLNHRSATCVKAKARDMATCKHFEGKAIARLQAAGAILWKSCPWGVHELMFAIRSSQGMEGVLFTGPFKASRAMESAEVFGIEGAKGTAPPEGPMKAPSWVHLLTPLVHSLEQALGRVPAGIDGKRADRVEHFLSKHYASPTVSVAQLSGALGLSGSATRAYLKKQFGRGFNELLTLRRLEMAALLLRYSEERVETVALSVGYEHARSFDKAFHRVHGVSPGRWRARNAKAV